MMEWSTDSGEDRKSLQIMILAICVLCADFNTLLNGFVYDDTWQIVSNEWITNVRYLPEIFLKDATHADVNTVSNYYRPMMNVVYMATYHLFSGLSSVGFHLVNIVFHFLVALSFFSVASLLFGKERENHLMPVLSAPFIATIIFALHPINSEVVAWVACIPEMSFSLFCLCTFYCHIKSNTTFDRWHLGSMLFFGLGLLSKETSVVILPILFVYDLACRDSAGARLLSLFKRYSPFAVVMAGYLMARMKALGGIAPSIRHPELNTFEVVINTVPLFSRYLQKLLVPADMNAFYVLHPVHSLADARWLVSFAIVAAFAVLGFFLFRKNRVAFIGWLMISIPLLPVMYIRGLGENTFADRYMYFPSLGFALIVAAFVTSTFGTRERLRVPATLLLVCGLAVYTVAAHQRNSVWRDSLSLWSDTERKSPDSYMARNELGVALLNVDQADKAIDQFRAALALKDDRGETHTNLGLALGKKGLLDAEIEEHKKAVAMSPTLFEAQYNLAYTLQQKGDNANAVTHCKLALAVNPRSYAAHFVLGRALGLQGQVDLEIREYLTALELEPNLPEVKHYLELALQRKGDSGSGGAIRPL